MSAVAQTEWPAEAASKPNGQPRPRWTAEEDAAWLAYFRGEREEIPGSRTVELAMRRFPVPNIAPRSTAEKHAMATAASQYLNSVPYRGDGCHSRFVEDVQRRAVYPDCAVGAGWPQKVFLAAVASARLALEAMQAPAHG